MGAGLVSAIFTAIASAAGFFSAPKGEYNLLRIVAIWCFAGAIAFLVPGKLPAFVLLALLLLAATPLNGRERVIIYAATFAALPDYFGVGVPFPGLNYLIRLDFAILSTLIILGPPFIEHLFSRAPKELRRVDLFIFLFVVISSVMSIRDLPVTSMLREAFYQVVLIYVPYIAISRTLTTRQDVEDTVKALFVGVAIMGAIAIISTVKDWNYYANVGENLRFKVFSGYRSGFLRIYGTVNPPLLAIMLGAGIIAAFYLRSIAAQDLYFGARACSCLWRLCDRLARGRACGNDHGCSLFRVAANKIAGAQVCAGKCRARRCPGRCYHRQRRGHF